MSIDEEHASSLLSKLPLDIVSMIAPYLSTRDVKAARLANSDLHFFLTLYLFRSITFAPYQRSLDILKTIATDPVLSYNTKTLYFDCTIFRLLTEGDPLDRREFYQAYFRSRERLDGTWVLPPKKLYRTNDGVRQAQHLRNYFEFASATMIIRKDLEAYMTSVFVSFPKLTTIILTNTFTTDISEFKYALQEVTVARKWVRPPQLLALFRAISNSSHSKITRIGTAGRMITKRWDSVQNDCYGNEDVVGTAKHGVSNYHSATYLKEKRPTIISSAFEMSPEDLQLTQTIFCNLTHLNLALATTQGLGEFDSFRTTPSTERCWAGLPMALSALTNIIDLSLDFKVHRRLDQQLVVFYYEDDLAEMFENLNTTMPLLRTLSLTQFRTSAESLVSFIDRHTKIQNLTLKHVIQNEKVGMHRYNYRASWYTTPAMVKFVENLRKRKLLRLNLLNVEGFQGHGNLPGREHTTLLYAQIHDYILHGYGDNPLSVACRTESWDEELW